MEKKEEWIQTYSGNKFYPFNPKAEDMHIGDIAHALSMCCRYSGHCEEFYSVSQHSVYVCINTSYQNALWGLLHDAAEAYIGDLASPIKSFMPEYTEVEDNILKVVAEKFCLPWPMPNEVKEVDRRVLLTEQRSLLKTPPEPWGLSKFYTPLNFTVFPILWKEARTEFLEKYKGLTK